MKHNKRIINNQAKMETKDYYQHPKIPIDQQGYTKSFSLQAYDSQELKAFYSIYGFVIFNDVVTQQEKQKTIDQLWADIQDRCGTELKRQDKSTWKFQGWKGSYGFVNTRPLNSLQICLNRQNPNVYNAFKTMYQLLAGNPLNEPLIAQFDRGSGMRPAKLNQQWRTQPFYHFDINPWQWTKVIPTPKHWKNINDYTPQKFEKWVSQGNFAPYAGHTKLAGVLALTNTNELSGGFQCVPGFQNCLAQWCKNTEVNTIIAKDEELLKQFQKIFQRKRSLLIFSRELPHNIYPNLSQQWRFAQYLRMSPLSALCLTGYEQEKRRICVESFLPKQLPKQDPICKEIYMMK